MQIRQWKHWEDSIAKQNYATDQGKLFLLFHFLNSFYTLLSLSSNAFIIPVHFVFVNKYNMFYAFGTV